MKKVLFLLFLVFSFGVYSATFSDSDKKEILKQFSEFQLEKPLSDMVYQISLFIT